MAKPRQREPWELKAEDLVRHVRGLLDYHGHAIEKALRPSLGKAEAQARLDQISALVEALELELWRFADPDRTEGVRLVQAIKGGMGKMGAAIVIAATSAVTTVLMTEAVEAIRDAEAKADEVIECVIQQEATDRTEDEQAHGAADVITDEDLRLATGRSGRTRRWIANLQGGRRRTERAAAPVDLGIGPPTGQVVNVPAPWESESDGAAGTVVQGKAEGTWGGFVDVGSEGEAHFEDDFDGPDDEPARSPTHRDPPAIGDSREGGW
jgi:hypothetical protein